MGRATTIRISKEEKRLLDEVRRKLYRSDSVPYAEVITEVMKGVLKRIEEKDQEAYEGDTIADYLGF